MPRTPTPVAPSSHALLLAAAALALTGCPLPGVDAARIPTPGKKPLTIEALYDPDKKVDFSGKPPSGLVWLDDDHYLWSKSDEKTKKREWLKVEAATGASQPFADAAKAEAAMKAIPGVTEEHAKTLAFGDTGAMNKAHTAILLDIEKDLWMYTFGADKAVRLTSTPEDDEESFGFSPDGKHASFVRKNDLFVVDVDPVAERQLTHDGSETVLNGKLDWLYQEEVYGRGNFGAHWWSPDSASIAFLRIDETGVPVYTLVDDVESPARVETSPYPRAGDTNPTVKLGVASASGGETRWMPLDKYKDIEFIIVDVSWSPKNELVFEVQDRVQTWLDLDVAELVVLVGYELTPSSQAHLAVADHLSRRSEGADLDSLHASSSSISNPDQGVGGRLAGVSEVRTLVHETTPAWVDNHGSPTWLKDGTFLWSSERSGWQHLYHYKADGTLIAPVTSGPWEARALHGVDEKNGWIYFSGTEHSPIASHAYRIKVDGTGLQRLTQTEGSHNVNFNPGFTRFIDNWSDASTPTQVHLFDAGGKLVRVVDENQVAALSEYELVKPEFMQVKTRDGFVMEAMLIKPAHFDPSRKYPVFQSTYAGPHSPSVRNGWGGSGSMFFQMLAQKGIAVWVCDNRSASGKGAESAWPCYLKLGETELADIEDGVAWLKQQAWVDGTRIGISGWSYGGFMTSYALTHSTSFCMGIAGGTVSDWHNYDTIYTERFMKTPKDNPTGYTSTSVTGAAKNLSGALLLVHGAMDDNVHPQNTMQLAYELHKAGKPFREMLYSKSQHGVSDPKLRMHMQAMMLEFIEEHLLGPHAG